MQQPPHQWQGMYIVELSPISVGTSKVGWATTTGESTALRPCSAVSCLTPRTSSLRISSSSQFHRHLYYGREDGGAAVAAVGRQSHYPTVLWYHGRLRSSLRRRHNDGMPVYFLQLRRSVLRVPCENICVPHICPVHHLLNNMDHGLQVVARILSVPSGSLAGLLARDLCRIHLVLRVHGVSAHPSW